jgi:hypothetical protein
MGSIIRITIKNLTKRGVFLSLSDEAIPQNISVRISNKNSKKASMLLLHLV